MTDDLVTRLREVADQPHVRGHRDGLMLNEAVARIEADAATIARLEGERDLYRQSYLTTDSLRLRAKTRAEAAEAKVAALETALLFYAASNNDHGIIARAAIAAAKGATINSEDRKGGTDGR